MITFLKSREQLWDLLEVGGPKVLPNVGNIPGCRSRSGSSGSIRGKTEKKGHKKLVHKPPSSPVKRPRVVIRKKVFPIKQTKAAFRWRTVCESYRTYF